MRDEMKFLIPFYAALAVGISVFLLYSLFGTGLAALATLVVAMVIAIAVLFVTAIGDEAGGQS